MFHGTQEGTLSSWGHLGPVPPVIFWASPAALCPHVTKCDAILPGTSASPRCPEPVCQPCSLCSAAALLAHPNSTMPLQCGGPAAWGSLSGTGLRLRPPRPQSLASQFAFDWSMVGVIFSCWVLKLFLYLFSAFCPNACVYFMRLWLVVIFSTLGYIVGSYPGWHHLPALAEAFQGVSLLQPPPCGLVPAFCEYKSHCHKYLWAYPLLSLKAAFGLRSRLAKGIGSCPFTLLTALYPVQMVLRGQFCTPVSAPCCQCKFLVLLIACVVVPWSHLLTFKPVAHFLVRATLWVPRGINLKGLVTNILN